MGTCAAAAVAAGVRASYIRFSNDVRILINAPTGGAERLSAPIARQHWPGAEARAVPAIPATRQKGLVALKFLA